MSNALALLLAIYTIAAAIGYAMFFVGAGPRRRG